MISKVLEISFCEKYTWSKPIFSIDKEKLEYIKDSEIMEAVSVTIPLQMEEYVYIKMNMTTKLSKIEKIIERAFRLNKQFPEEVGLHKKDIEFIRKIAGMVITTYEEEYNSFYFAWCNASKENMIFHLSREIRKFISKKEIMENLTENDFVNIWREEEKKYQVEVLHSS